LTPCGLCRRVFTKKADAVLGPLLKRLGIENGVRLERIRSDWAEIFDTGIAPHMFPASLKDGELLLNLESPVWMQNLTYYKKEILSKLSPYGITGVRFRLGRIQKQNHPSENKRKERKLSEEEIALIAAAVSTIHDDELKKSVQKAWQKSLAFARDL
jgi:hypothetical protein